MLEYVKFSDRAGERSKITLTLDGVKRCCVLHVPAGLAGKTNVPVVCVLHGAGGSAETILKDTQWTRKADSDNFIAIFPEALPLKHEEPPDFFKNPQVWDDGQGRGAVSKRRVDDAEYIRLLLDILSENYSLDPHRLYAAGFSNGGSMVFQLGIRLNRRFRALAVVAGYCRTKETGIDCPISLLYIAGTEDPVVPFHGGKARLPWQIAMTAPPVSDSVQTWAALLGCDAEPEIVQNEEGIKLLRYLHCKEGTEILFYVIEGMGHMWPGAAGALPEGIVGKPTDKLNATDVIWEFFSSNS